MKVNKKEWRLLSINGNLHFAVKAGSLATAHNYIKYHLPNKAVLSALKTIYINSWEAYDALDILKFRTDKLRKFENEYILCLTSKNS